MKGKNIMYQGIDYGNGLTNIDKNGIRFGIIPVNAVCQAWCDSSEPEYSNRCPFCAAKPKGKKNIHELFRCGNCRKKLFDGCFDGQEPICFYIDDGEYKAFSDSDGIDITILSSPYYTYAQFCSPCCPGGIYLLNPLTERIENNRAYCFFHDFFDYGKAPYPVYSIETNELLNP